MRVRRFQDKDAAAIARLHRATIRNVNAKDYSESQVRVWSLNISAQRVRASSLTRVVFVALDAEKVIGFVEYSGTELLCLYIHKDFLGRGVGSKLVEKVEHHAKKHGVDVLYCTSTITAHTFYKKQGFKTLRKMLYPMGEEKLLVYRMRKKL